MLAKPRFERLQKWKNDLATCIRCGYCYEHCPFFKNTNWEADTPRGKLLILHGLLTGDLEARPELVEKIFECFYCKNCVNSCSANVPFTDILNDARADLLDAGFEPEGSIVGNDEELCSRCGVCVSICAHEALVMEKDEEGNKKVVVDKVKCTGCGVCVAACPSGAMSQKQGYQITEPELLTKVMTLLDTGVG